MVVKPSTRCTLRIASLPATSAVIGVPQQGNPYVDLFAAALTSEGVEYVSAVTPTRKWLVEEAATLDAIHIHWPEPVWRQYRPRLLRAVQRRMPGGSCLAVALRWPLQLAGLYLWRKFLHDVRHRDLRIIWTLHDIEHPIGMSWLDRAGRRALAASADLLICHSEAARTEFLQQYRTNADTVVMRHGSYEGVYPAPRPAAIVRKELGLRCDLPVVGCIGLLRDTKGLDLAIDAVRHLRGRVQLIVGGRPNASYNLSRLQEKLSTVSGTALVARWLSDQELADLTCASDAILLPYKKITTSGALLTALSFGRPVVTSDLPFFKETLAAEPEAGVLVPSGDAFALARGIEKLLAVPIAAREAAVRRLIASYRWTEVVQPVITVLRQWKNATR